MTRCEWCGTCSTRSVGARELPRCCCTRRGAVRGDPDRGPPPAPGTGAGAPVSAGPPGAGRAIHGPGTHDAWPILEGWVEGPVAEGADLRGINTLMLDFLDDPDFVRDLFDDRQTALLSLVLYLFVPGKLFFFPLLNTVTPVLILTCAYLLQRWLLTAYQRDG